MSTTVATFGVPAEPEWAALTRRATPNVFLHPAALAAAASAGLAPLRVLQAWHGDRPRRLVGLWAVQQARTTPLGPTCLATPPYEYAFLSNPVVDPEFMHEAVDAFLDLIASDARLPRVLRLRYLDADCPSYFALLAALAARGARWMEVSRRARPFVTRTSGRKLQGATHGKLRQKWNRLCAAGPVAVRHDRAPDAVREAFETYLALEGASWKGERGTAMLSNPDLARFSRQLIAGLARDGSASVALLTLGGRAIAAQVVLHCGSMAYTWKTAFDAAYGEFSPGALLVDKVTEQLFATEGIEAIESCSPEGGFMERMWSGRRATVDLVADLGMARSLPFSVAALGARTYAQLRAVHHALRDPSLRAMPGWSGAASANGQGRAPAVITTAADDPRPAGQITVAVARHADTVVCSPHFDDAVLCCWSVLDRDKDCAVVNVFTGAPDDGFTSWIDQLNGASTSALHMCQRELEDRKALSVAGKAPIDLGMLEVQYRLRQSPALHALLRRMRLLRFVLLRLPLLRSALYAVSAPSPEKLADAIMQAAPGAANVCAPAAIGGHADHLLVRQAAAVLASRGMNVRLYADMPYAVRYGWPRWIGAPDGPRATDRATAFWVRHLKALRLDDPMQMATVVRLTPEERARKASAIRQYATQIGALSAGRMRGWLQDAALAYEVYWQLRPATGEQPQRAFLGGQRFAASTGAMSRGACKPNGPPGTAAR